MRTKNRDEFGNPIDPALEQFKEEYRRTHQSDMAPQGNPSIQMENAARMNAARIREEERQANLERKVNPQNGLDLARKIAKQNNQSITEAQSRADIFRSKILGAQIPRFNELRKKLR